MDLNFKTCKPCKGGILPLSRAEAQDYIKNTPMWSLSEEENRIRREFRFDDYIGVLKFVNQVGSLSEAEGHHPEITFGWGYADIEIYTHKINGLHENDFILASKISEIFTLK